MCQAEALKVLKKNKGKWITTKDVAKAMKIGTGSVTNNLNCLFQQGLILKVENNSWVIPTTWKYKE